MKGRDIRIEMKNIIKADLSDQHKTSIICNIFPLTFTEDEYKVRPL